MQYHYYLYGMRVTADLDFVQLDPVRLPEDDRDFGREKVRIPGDGRRGGSTVSERTRRLRLRKFFRYRKRLVV